MCCGTFTVHSEAIGETESSCARTHAGKPRLERSKARRVDGANADARGNCGGGACLSLTVLRLSTLFISPALSIALGSLQRLLPCSQLEGGCASYRCSVKVRVSELVIMPHRRRVETTRDSARP